MRKGFLITVSLLTAMIFMVSCGDKEESSPTTYKDGFYYAEEEGFSPKTGWKYVVTLEVKDGKITDAVWNGAHVSAGEDKITQSKSGAYGMVEKGGAQAPWADQAEKAAAFLLEQQNPAAITYTDDEGHTDAISGVSIHVIEFFNLVEKALIAGPVGMGPYKNGHFSAEDPEFTRGWKTTANFTVIGGRIASANWDAVSEDGSSKKEASRNGEYGMVANGGAQSPWADQAVLAEQYLLKTQDPTKINYKDDEGHTDAISGVSIHVNEFFNLAEKALERR